MRITTIALAFSLGCSDYGFADPADIVDDLDTAGDVSGHDGGAGDGEAVDTADPASDDPDGGGSGIEGGPDGGSGDGGDGGGSGDGGDGGDPGDDVPDDVDDGCTGTVGYWSNHEWDATLILGDRSYDEAELREILGLAPAGDVSIQVARQLISAKLAGVYGADLSAAQAAIDAADQWLIDNDDGDGIPLGVSSDAEANDLIGDLDGYNQGFIGPDHC